MTDDPAVSDAGRLLALHLAAHPGDADRLAGLSRRIASAPAGLLDRSCMAGHLTASMLVLDPSRAAGLCVLHRGTGLWLQPGGHYEPPGLLLDTALREVREETGLVDVTVLACGPVHGAPLDVDSHAIPADPRKGEGDHLHHDFCWLGLAGPDQVLAAQAAEVGGIAWVPLEELAGAAVPRVARLARRTLGLVRSG